MKEDRLIKLFGLPDLHLGYIKLGDTMFPEVQWSDKEPTRIKITIEK